MKRRDFIHSGATAAALATAGTVTAENPPDGKTRRVALIGSGWYGKVDLLRLIQVEPVEVVALCDVDSKMLAEAVEIVAGRQKSGNRPKGYTDYRELLEKEKPDLVLIASPDHWHALHAIAAMEAGADLYLQKPISVDVVEAQAVFAAARKLGRVVQIGTQRRSTPHLIEAREKIVEKGLLGKIRHAEVCCYYHMRARQNPPDADPPAHLDYDLWTGPAPLRPYNELVHPRRWRAFMEYSNGIVGDMCVHMLDTVRWMLDLGWPRKVSSHGGIYVQTDAKANTTDTQNAVFDYGDLQVVWQHRSWGTPPDPDYPWAFFLYGDKGTLKGSVNRYDFIPRGGGSEPVHRDVVMELDAFPEDRDEKDLERHVAPAVRRHMQDLLTAIDSRGRPVADVEEGFISTVSCILANVALEVGRELRWDAEAGRVIDDEEANRLLARPYRQPWRHPDPADYA